MTGVDTTTARVPVEPLVVVRGLPPEPDRPAREVLVVEDHPVVVAGLPPLLRQAGLRVSVATSAAAYVETTGRYPDLVVQGSLGGVRVPPGGPFADAIVLRLLESHEMRGERSRNALRRPFSLDDAACRVRELLRRNGLVPSGDTGILRCDTLVLDESSEIVQLDGVLVQLAPTEYRLLRHLLSHADDVVTKAQALRRAWPYDFGGTPQVVEQYVGVLRRKLGDRAPLIRTVRGRGYVLGSRGRGWRA